MESQTTYTIKSIADGYVWVFNYDLNGDFWARQLREVGHVMPGEVGGHRLPILRDEGEWLLLRMKQEPHVSLRQLQAELEVRGIIVSYGSVWNFVHSLNQSFKKNSSRRRATKA